MLIFDHRFKNTKSIYMKKSIGTLSVIGLLVMLFAYCTKTNNNATGDWDINATADAGGSFDIVATADINVEGKTFTATVTTTTIGGAAEEHVIEIDGDVEGDKLVVNDFEFPVVIGTDTNMVTLSVTITIDGDNLTGSGDYSEVIPGIVDPVEGTLTLTGTKKK
jgi:hypothetical protein